MDCYNYGRFELIQIMLAILSYPSDPTWGWRKSESPRYEVAASLRNNPKMIRNLYKNLIICVIFLLADLN